MLFYPLVLLVVGMIVTTLNLVGGSVATIRISWILLLIGIVFAAIYTVSGRSAEAA